LAGCGDCNIRVVDSFPNAIHRLLSEDGSANYDACFAFNIDTATTDFIDYLLSQGGQYGNCPEEDYFARCNYVGQEFGDALIQFTDTYAGESDTSALATCGLYQGIFISPNGFEDTRQSREPNELHQGFVRPVYLLIETQDGEFMGCQQIETASHSQSLFETMMENENLYFGACPDRGYRGACHAFAEGSDIAMVTFWMDTILGRLQESVCRQNAGVWEDL